MSGMKGNPENVQLLSVVRTGSFQNVEKPEPLDLSSRTEIRKVVNASEEADGSNPSTFSGPGRIWPDNDMESSVGGFVKTENQISAGHDEQSEDPESTADNSKLMDEANVNNSEELTATLNSDVANVVTGDDEFEMIGNDELKKFPKTAKEFLERFSFVNIAYNLVENLRLLRQEPQKTILDTCRSSFANRRPTGSVIFVTFGEHTAKTTAMNKLFNCNTIDLTPNTRPLHSSRKILDESGAIAGFSFETSVLEFPSFHDTTKDQVQNVALLKKLNEFPDLQSRHELINIIRESQWDNFVNIQDKVYPNAVLYFLSANDNRLLEQSQLRRSLEIIMACGTVVDTRNPNLIFVISNCMAWGSNLESHEKRLSEIREALLNVVHEVFGLKEMPVIAIENNLRDYVPLGDTTFSHLENTRQILSDACAEMFVRNDDVLGKILLNSLNNEVGEDGACNELKLPVESQDLTLALDLLKQNEIPVSKKHDAKEFLSDFLGHGFNPKLEKHCKPLISEVGTREQVIAIGNKTFLVSNLLTNCPQNKAPTYSLAPNSKIEYEEDRKSSYGLENDISLVVDNTCSDEWANPEKSLYFVSVHIRLQSLLINPSDEASLSEDFLFRLKALPSVYEEGKYGIFAQFFEEYGTHMVLKECIGGRLKIFYCINPDSLDGGHNSVCSAVKLVIESENLSITDAFKNVGAVFKSYKFNGGEIGEDIAELTSEVIKEWIDSILNAPAALIDTILLYPHYHWLINSENYNSLRDATRDYLRNIPNQDVVAQVRCFPAKTRIALKGDVYEPVSNLSKSSKLVTFQTKFLFGSGELEFKHSLVHTKFCTYLHKDVNTSAEYLVLHFSNGQTLRISEGHLMFQYNPATGCISAKQACTFKIGELSVYKSHKDKFETPKLVNISRTILKGIYCPLTDSGTFLADGFLVTSYAHVKSFALSHAAMMPLTWFCRIANLVKQERNADVQNKRAIKKSSASTIHLYAKFLMQISGINNVHKPQEQV